jgi:cytochrome subunit of sulfide dehydrogenase
MYATRLVVAAVIGLAAALSLPAAAAEPPVGAAACSGCHAARAGVDTSVPPLAGRNPAEMVEQMQAFRSGQRPATVMNKIAKGFSDAELQAIAAWYAEQR